MFIRMIPDNKGKRPGYYCALVESERHSGTSVHKVLYNFGFLDSEHAIYLKAAFSQGDPASIVKKWMQKNAT